MLKIVVHLDSYKHWFDGNIDRSIEDSAFRPDFLVIEVSLQMMISLNWKQQ